MKAFDFDNTLYFGESSVDFALFMMKKNKKIILWLPRIFWGLLKYKLCLISREKIEDDTTDPRILITKRGIGYYIAKPD